MISLTESLAAKKAEGASGYVWQAAEVKKLIKIHAGLWHRGHELTISSKDGSTNPRGIPYAPFVDKVEDYVSSRAEVDGTMKSFQEMISYDRISMDYGRQS